MADIDKIKLPNNTVVNIKDSRIPGVDTEPTSGSDNVVTSDGVYDAIESSTVWERGSGSNSVQTKNTNSLANGTRSVAEGSGYDNNGYFYEAKINISGTGPTYNTGWGGGNARTPKIGSLVSYNGIYAKVVETSVNTITLDRSLGDFSEDVYLDEHLSAQGDYSHAEGLSTTTIGIASHAEGYNVVAEGRTSHAEGKSTIASGDISHSEGANTKSLGLGSHAEGSSTTASGNYSHAEGWSTIAFGSYSHAEGCNSGWMPYPLKISGTANSKTYTATGNIYNLNTGDLVRGDNITVVKSVNPTNFTTEDFLFNSDVEDVFFQYRSNGAIGDFSHAEGYNTTAFSNGSHAEGYSVQAKGIYSHAEGYHTATFGYSSHAEGQGSHSWGHASHAEGYEGVANADASHAEGRYTIASGDNSHAEGLQTESSGDSSHAEGNETSAQGIASHAEGVNTEAIGTGSHTEGVGTVANNNGEHAEGLYNKSNSDTISSIGIGDSDSNRKNALECLNNGKIYVYDVGGYAGTNVSGNSLSVHLKTNAINNREWNFIFDISEPITNDNYLCCLYIDDFPDSSCWEDHGFDSLEDLIEAICESSYDMGNSDSHALYGVNLFMPLTETVEYEGEIYDLWEVMTYNLNSNRFTKGNVYGLLSQDATYTELHNNSMEVDVTNEYYPFYIVSAGNTPDEGGMIYVNSENYRLIKAKQISHISNPIDANHSSTIEKIILDDFSDFSFYAQVYNYVRNDSINDFIDEIKTNDYFAAQTFINTGETFTYEGVEYDIWVNDYDNCYGGLMPHNITYQDLYPHSIECDSRNIYTKYCPFVVRFNDCDGETIYTERENTDNYTTLICVI